MPFLQLKWNHFTEIPRPASQIIYSDTGLTHILRGCSLSVLHILFVLLKSSAHLYNLCHPAPSHALRYPSNIDNDHGSFLQYILSFSLISKSNTDHGLWCINSLWCPHPILTLICIGKLYCGVCQVCQCNWEGEESQLDQVLRITLQTIE